MASQVTINVKLHDEDADSTRTTFTLTGAEKPVSGFGIEDEKRAVKVHGETRIDNGVYDVIFNFSPKFSPKFYRDDRGELIYYADRKSPEQIARYHTQHESMEIINVKNFSKIRIHWGTTDDDTEGCYIEGHAPGAKSGFRVTGKVCRNVSSSMAFREVEQPTHQNSL
jgi:hypothetical protein